MLRFVPRYLLASLILLIPLTACANPNAPTGATSSSSKTSSSSNSPNTATAPSTAVAPSKTAREGVDYETLPTPQPTYATGKIEVAEVFSYGCIHCAQFQPLVNAWKKTMPSDVRWQYVPAVFGNTWDNYARAYFAAEAMGILNKTHDAVFKGVFVDKLVQKGTVEEIADMYAKLGVNRTKFLATMQSFGITGKLSHAKQFALRTGISGTPTLIINGKYRINVTRDRGFDGMLATANELIARERAQIQAAKAP